MAHRLEALLHPGEEIVFEDLSNRKLIWAVLALMVILIVVWGAYAWITALTVDGVFLIFYLMVLTLACIALQRWFYVGAAVVTDRRLLLDCAPMAALWGWQRIHDIPHGDIAKVTRSTGVWLDILTLVLADGRQISLGSIINKDGLAEALNAVAGARKAHREATD